MNLHLHRRRHDLAAQRTGRQRLQIGIADKARSRRHQNVFVVLGALPLVAGERRHKLIQVFGVGIRQHFRLSVAGGGIPARQEVVSEQLPVFGDHRDFHRLTGRETAEFGGRLQLVQIAGQMRDLELIVIYPQGLARAVEIDDPVFAVDRLAVVAEGEQHPVARGPVSAQRRAIHAVFAGAVIQHFHVQLQLAKLIHQLLIGHGAPHAAQESHRCRQGGKRAQFECVHLLILLNYCYREFLATACRTWRRKPDRYRCAPP